MFDSVWSSRSLNSLTRDAGSGVGLMRRQLLAFVGAATCSVACRGSHAAGVAPVAAPAAPPHASRLRLRVPVFNSSVPGPGPAAGEPGEPGSAIWAIPALLYIPPAPHDEYAAPSSSDDDGVDRGVLLAVAEAREARLSDDAPCTLGLRRSTDGGRTWPVHLGGASASRTVAGTRSRSGRSRSCCGIARPRQRC